jgi:hypothetical protein
MKRRDPPLVIAHLQRARSLDSRGPQAGCMLAADELEENDVSSALGYLVSTQVCAQSL